MSEVAKTTQEQVKANAKPTPVSANTIVERNTVASPMQAKEGAKAVVISAKEQKVEVKTQDNKAVVSETSKEVSGPNKAEQKPSGKEKTSVSPKVTSTPQIKPQQDGVQTVQVPKAQVSTQNVAKTEINKTTPAQKNVAAEKSNPNSQVVKNSQTQKEHASSQVQGKTKVALTTSKPSPVAPKNQATAKSSANNLQQGSKTVVTNNQSTTKLDNNTTMPKNEKQQTVQAKPLATPVQASSPAVVKTVENEKKQEQEEHRDIFKDLYVKLKSVWQNLNAGVKRYLAIVLIPSLLCLGYFGLWASPMYISEVKFAVKSAEGGTSGFNLMTTLFRVPTASLQDAMVVEEFLKSNDAFYAADKELDLIKHYTDQNYDLISRLSFAPTIDDIASFWNNVTKINVNQDSNVITFEVRAYTPEMAQNINEEVLHISEDLVNSMNERAKEDMLQLADLEVAEARDRLTVAQDALRDFRNKNQDLDLKATAAGMQSLVIELESQAALLRTQIAEQSRYTDRDAPALKALRDRLVGVEEQIERERSRLTEVSAQGTSLNTLASQYENLVTEAEFARQRLLFAMNSLESAKADILAKNLYIVTVAKPSLPDESLYPKPFLFTFYIFVALSMAYGVISLIVAAIKEHMGY